MSNSVLLLLNHCLPVVVRNAIILAHRKCSNCFTIMIAQTQAQPHSKLSFQFLNLRKVDRKTMKFSVCYFVALVLCPQTQSCVEVGLNSQIALCINYMLKEKWRTFDDSGTYESCRHMLKNPIQSRQGGRLI